MADTCYVIANEEVVRVTFLGNGTYDVSRNQIFSTEELKALVKSDLSISDKERRNIEIFMLKMEKSYGNA